MDFQEIIGGVAVVRAVVDTFKSLRGIRWNDKARSPLIPVYRCVMGVRVSEGTMVIPPSDGPQQRL
jgi:hypothetical protein